MAATMENITESIMAVTKNKDLAGMRFGRLVVIRKEDLKNKRRTYWLCKCDCGNETVVEESHLKSGHTKSCGCYHKERLKEKSMDLRGHRYGRVTVLEPAIREDGAEGYWNCRCDCGNHFVSYKENLRSGMTRSCGCLQKETRKENMKKAIHFANGTCIERIASRVTSSNNTSGHRGVYRRKNNRWRATIGFQGKVYNLGTFETYEDAVQARLDAETKYYDAFLEEYMLEKNEE